ncbi:NAD(P)H-quinone oxidoreductase [Luteibacter jiangsuensis]|uniref:NAD(P)H-quinone oxidoreductase n=1 Tax=Luteibacter jiangsuensis TaxID=637577 RepID=A0ABX0Q8X1_9GAMM|nr:NAD(P)H-quinone oxidoreductase [Luteibacter jiangsuensis]NID05638.1 NAD(P)H-quinone oxidoreductase [Luteibacter jiangsuensis]
MKAIDFTTFGDPDVLKLVDVEPPEVRQNDLLVRVHAAGVNRADLLLRTGHYGRPDFGDSRLIGLEVAGEVVSVGDGVKGFAIGDRIMGITGGGAYAELARLDYRMAMPIPHGLDYTQAAAIPEVFVTAHEALVNLGRLTPHESVLIHAAASGVGSAAVQLAHALGARVFATAAGGKLERVRALGADIPIDYKHRDFVEVIHGETNGTGVDVIVDFIGAPYFARNIESLNYGGRLVQVGLLGGGEGATVDLERVIYRHLQILGTVMKSRTQEAKQAMVKRFRDQWLERFADGTLVPVIDSVYPLADAAEAHRRMETNQSIGKIVLTNG